MSDIRAYLHGHYDGDEEERKRQQQDDARRSIEVKREIEDAQNAVFEYETEALSHEMEEKTREKFEELCRIYNTKDKYKEYLVDGAVLQCTKATMEDFELPGGKKIILERSEYDDENARVQMILHVRENGMDDKGRYYATVKDCVQGINIFWSTCNCMMPADREEEKKRIEQDKECSRFGVCRHLMQLNEKWDNMPLYGLEEDSQNEDRTYLTKRNVYVKEGAPKMDFEDMPEEYLASEDIEGITMTSVLFCKHGGLICPITSGQEMTYETNYETNYEATFTYINRNGTITTASWNISDTDFINYEALSLDEIKKICESKNPDLVSLGYAEGIYNYCKEYKINPKILLATLGQEQGWCKNGKYEKAFGVGPGGNPSNFNNSTSGIVAAIQVLINKYNEGLAKESLILKNINCDPAPDYFETKAVYKDKLADWQQKNPEYVTYMEHGQDIVCVNAAMYAKLSYTPWVDFPPQDSHPLEDWLAIYNSLEDCLRSE